MAQTSVLPAAEAHTVLERPGLLYVPYPAAEGWAQREQSPGATPSPGFRGVESIDLVLALVDEPGRLRDPSSGGLARRFSIELGPGKIRVKSSALGHETTPLAPPPDPEQLALRTPEGAPSPDGPAEAATRGAISLFSRRSRARMVETMCSIDWAPIVNPDQRGWRPAMVTLTLPGDWRAVAPDAVSFKAMVERFYKRWTRKWGKPSWFWKLEFQRRGAPHLHIYTALPLGKEFRQWLSLAWYEVVGSGDERHLRAGTGVDWGEGMRASDPKRLAVYFAKRATGHNQGKDKEYQHLPPPEWCGVDFSTGEIFDGAAGAGRFWGARGLDKAVGQAEIDDEQFWQLRRIMRRWAKSRGREVRSLYGPMMCGGMVLANDAPALLAQMLRWAMLAAGDHPPRHPDPILP